MHTCRFVGFLESVPLRGIVTIGEVTNLQTILEGKSDTTHTHSSYATTEQGGKADNALPAKLPVTLTCVCNDAARLAL